MPKTQTERTDDSRTTRPGPPPLSANIRRHLSLGLRSLYDQTPASPVDERIEALLARLDRPRS